MEHHFTNRPEGGQYDVLVNVHLPSEFAPHGYHKLTGGNPKCSLRDYISHTLRVDRGHAVDLLNRG